MKKALYVIRPDEEPDFDTKHIRYKYSDKLFDWFYKRVKYYSSDLEEWEVFEFNEEWTREDNSKNGCRITLSDHSYIKFYDTYFLMEFGDAEWEKIEEGCKRPTMEDVINYFYDKAK